MSFGSPVRERLARFIQGEGHRVEMALSDDESVAELLFRTRGYVVSVTVHEGEPPRFEVATAYEIPSWARERAQNATVLQDVADDADGVHFTLAPDGKHFVAVLECAGLELEAFQSEFWGCVGRVRDAGISALERIFDRSESRAAADKFIKSLQSRGTHGSG